MCGLRIIDTSDGESRKSKRRWIYGDGFSYWSITFSNLDLVLEFYLCGSKYVLYCIGQLGISFVNYKMLSP